MWSIATFVFVGLVAVYSSPLIGNENVEKTILTLEDTTLTNDSVVNDGVVETTKATLIGNISEKIAATIIDSLASNPTIRDAEASNDTIVSNPTIGEAEASNNTILINRTLNKEGATDNGIAIDSSARSVEPIIVTLHEDLVGTESVTPDTLPNDSTVVVEATDVTLSVESNTETEASIKDTGATVGAAIGHDTLTKDGNIKSTADTSDNYKSAILVDDSLAGGSKVENVRETIDDPLAKYNLSERMLIDKLKFLMRNEVCGEKPLKLDAILPDILKGAKAGNCKYKCERYFCQTCVKSDYKEGPFVAVGNCSIWSDGLEFEVDYTGKFYEDLITYNIYFETTAGDQERKLYKSGTVEATETIDDRIESPSSMPYPVAAYIIHALLSG